METVVVLDPKHPNGEYVINAEDFDPKAHTLKGEEKPKPKKGKTEGGE